MHVRDSVVVDLIARHLICSQEMGHCRRGPNIARPEACQIESPSANRYATMINTNSTSCTDADLMPF
jgi:hypothetical protein